MMWRPARTLFTLLLALVLGATSLTMAVARGQTRAAGEIVICTGYGFSTITVDANGDPVGPVHICPDMVLGLMAALDAPPVVFMRPEGRVERLAPPAPHLVRARRATLPRARGPPGGGAPFA
ncbi:hypothetical protein [Phaeovulum vinaykumarii]|uniref:Uncharacterized protein n=1 Tax=Phaeovulum vinaykumarii TaxID=407234 RepID=A0A1N7L1I6_9RHOB|nr:hypothetical protein [Phaeovulum vinaykumarii]SIS67606.1 hypothetical protein SAMN05421795_102419 [Phaeovulum vinaykumarii]SOC00653.1 hypothetical protein SAMN05878426_102353 [Phaeovulum vinaykumarii]